MQENKVQVENNSHAEVEFLCLSVCSRLVKLCRLLSVPGRQRSTQRAPGPHLSGRGDGCRQPHHPGAVQNRRGPQRHQDGVPGGRMNCTGTGTEGGGPRGEGEREKREGGVEKGARRGCKKRPK